MKLHALWLSLAVAFAGDVLACSCITVGDDPAPIPSRDIVFRGRVVATQLVVVGDDGNMFLTERDRVPARLYRVAVLEVSERFKGDIPPYVIIATGSGGGDCGYSFETGQNYVVDGEWTEDNALARLGGGARVVTTSICSLTAPEDKAESMLQRLRKRYKADSPLFVR
jgi:hypothetical protein